MYITYEKKKKPRFLRRTNRKTIAPHPAFTQQQRKTPRDLDKVDTAPAAGRSQVREEEKRPHRPAKVFTPVSPISSQARGQ